MDKDVCRWIIEFILRSSMNDHLLKRTLAVMPFPDNDFRLKKTVLLRAIESERSEAVVTEKVLAIFEMIEQLDKTEGLAMMDSMKSAYCAVAVECTVKYLAVEGMKNNGKYFDTVSRIWRGRVMELKRSGRSELVSRELEEWKDEVEAALWDKTVWKKLVNMNTRYEALKLIGDYLGEAWGVLGPSFLELSASLMDNRTRNEMQSVQLEQAIDKTAVASEDVGGSGGIELPSQTENHARPEHQGSVPVLTRAETKRKDVLDMNQDSGVNNNSKRSSTVEMNTERVQGLPTETTEGQESIEKEVTVLQDRSPNCRKNLKTSILPRCKSLASHKRVRGGAKIDHLEDLENDSSSGKSTCLQTPEFERVREALKTSSLELQALVKDPLPDALRIAESVAQDLAKKNKTPEHSLEDQNDAVAANPAINKDNMPLQSMNTAFNNPRHGHQTIVPRPSIMERNSSACTYEWNDSIDGSPERNRASRLHLPSPKRKVISPLKKYEENRLVWRRKCKRWSLLEEDTLRTAVQRFGKGNWKLILNSYREIFDDRTEVDLKDKWRNMTRY
ncbi:Telomeric repeat-binding factor 1, partial [Cucurbita argyrosperma subsp. sororia]